MFWPFIKAHPIPNRCGGTEWVETRCRQERVYKQPAASARNQSREAQNNVRRDKKPGNDSATPFQHS